MCVRDEAVQTKAIAGDFSCEKRFADDDEAARVSRVRAAGWLPRMAPQKHAGRYVSRCEFR
jgi:hypothetical protein